MTQRTLLQNRALHLYFQMVADKLNESGQDVRQTLRHDIEIPWTEELVKDHLWRVLQKAMTKKESTTELDTKEISEIYEVLSRHLATKLGVDVPFPDHTGE